MEDFNTSISNVPNKPKLAAYSFPYRIYIYNFFLLDGTHIENGKDSQSKP